MLKTYRIYQEKTRPIEVQLGGVSFLVDFQQIGFFKDFSTRDEKVQEAMENDIRFKSVYFLVYEEGELEKSGKSGKSGKSEESEDDKDGRDDNDNKDDGEDLEGDGEYEEYPDIKTLQEAKALLKAKGINVANAANKASVVKIGKENRVRFPQLTVDN